MREVRVLLSLGQHHHEHRGHRPQLLRRRDPHRHLEPRRGQPRLHERRPVRHRPLRRHLRRRHGHQHRQAHRQREAQRDQDGHRERLVHAPLRQRNPLRWRLQQARHEPVRARQAGQLALQLLQQLQRPRRHGVHRLHDLWPGLADRWLQGLRQAPHARPHDRYPDDDAHRDHLLDQQGQHRYSDRLPR